MAVKIHTAIFWVTERCSAVTTDVGEKYRGADKSLARPGRKQATVTEDFDFRISYL